MPGNGTVGALFVLQKNGRVSRGEKLVCVFVDSKEAFDGIPRKIVEWALRKKGIPQVMMKEGQV